MKKIIKKFKENILGNKRNLFIFIGVMIILIIIFIIVIVLNNKGSLIILGDNDAKIIMSEYEKLNDVKTEDGYNYPKVNIDKDNKFTYTNIDEILNIFDNEEDAVIFFGYASCFYCRTVIQVLHDVSVDTEIDKIFYLDVEEKVEKYDRLLKVLDDKFINIENDDVKVFSPLVLFVADGKVVSHFNVTLFSDDGTFYNLEQSQIDDLSQIFRYGIQDVING